jgi:diguanylate cyclase (GGDEF)-like protein
VRPSDTVARLGGDEFAVLIEEIDADPEINLIGKRLHSAFDEPFSAAGQTFDLTASIGRAVWPSEVGELETLLRQADAAMYEVKRTRQPA